MTHELATSDTPHPLRPVPFDATDTLENTAYSPLWLVTTEPMLNQFVLRLQRLRAELHQAPQATRELRVTRTELAQVRAAFANMIRHGEERLHQLSQLLCDRFLGDSQLQSVVIGAVESTRERFTLTQSITAADLYSTTDLDLGTRQLNKLRFWDGQQWSGALLIANVVDYQPIEPNPYAIHHISTRIKAEEEIWNKVVDEIFELDRLIVTDKKLRHLSRYVKDVFGIKIVVGEAADVYRVQDALQGLAWSEQQVRGLQLDPSAETRRLHFVEVKNYLEQDDQKQSGWAALKSVVRWTDKTFEIQIQPLRNFLNERERLTNESHLSFKIRREQVRQQVAEQIPLFRFYQELLRWLFLQPSATPPQHPGVAVTLED